MGTGLRFDDPALLRVAWVADVLHNCGQILACSAGTEETYKLSSQAGSIQVFISHNWAFERKRKFLALAMHFNLNMAIGLATAALVLGTCFTYIVARRQWSAIPIEKVPVTCTVTMLTFVIALLFGHEGPALVGFKGKSVFLDKACIHQTNPTLKERGIRNLGVFLHRSDGIVVCFTEIYLKRLWTVYEFASFLLVHGATQGLVHVVPPRLPVLVLASSLCAFGGVVSNRVAAALGDYTAVMTIMGDIAAGGIIVGLARWWALQQFEACAIFNEFALANTSCVSESDRALVQSNIITLMRHVGRVDAHAPDEEALAAFDKFVRTAGSRAFATSVGRLGVPYKLFLPIPLVIFSNAMQMWSAAIGYQYSGHRDAAQIVLMLTAHLSSAFALLPLAAALILHLAKCFPRLRGVGQVVLCGAVALVAVAVIAALDPTVGVLRPWLLDPAVASERSCWGFVLYCAALFASTAWVYREPQRKVVEQGPCREPEGAATGLDDGKVDLQGHVAEAGSVQTALRRVGSVIEASGMIVELRMA